MTLDDLIAEGEEVRKTCHEDNDFAPGGILKGLEYEAWITKSTLFLEGGNYSQTVVKKFLAASENAPGNSVSHYDTMMGVLKGLKAFE